MASLAGRQAWERIIQAVIICSQPKASDFIIWAEAQKGWQPTQTPNGPLKYVDKNGITRLTLKQGSQRTPGSHHPHVELRNAKNQRIDPQGNLVSRRSIANHTPINWDI